ncbi:MAG: 3-phosphoshikimate 1-carboxyvinyltransferase [Lachnospiraceae bacterium]|nr:3-phosphoshikimate 1-carboxyvinyltransferase [Lachnospiraceae bacterium]
MNTYQVPCIKNKKVEDMLQVSVPGSKSITNRALLLAAMAEGESTLYGCLKSEDAAYFLQCLETLGFPVQVEGTTVRITGFGGKIPKQEAEIYVGSAGTAARFLAAMCAFSDGCYTLQSSDQMKKRPMGPLIETLREAGAEITCLEDEGHFPMRIKGCAASMQTCALTVNIDKSSQFLSALLIAAGTRKEEVVIALEGSHGMAYVEMTAAMMADFGVQPMTKKNEEGVIIYTVAANSSYKNLEYQIEPDMSAAAYFYALGAITGGKVMIPAVHKTMLQGDVAFLDVLCQMGCSLEDAQEGVVLSPSADGLHGNKVFDLSAFSDQALTLAAIASFADGPITIKGISHIRGQECDRIYAIVENLKVLGADVSEVSDVISINPSVLHGGEIETFEDHRVAMSFALPGLLTEGVVIKNPECCRKTFAEYFEVLDDVIGKFVNE